MARQQLGTAIKPVIEFRLSSKRFQEAASLLLTATSVSCASSTKYPNKPSLPNQNFGGGKKIDPNADVFCRSEETGHRLKGTKNRNEDAVQTMMG